jgi:hypothetical protein
VHAFLRTRLLLYSLYRSVSADPGFVARPGGSSHGAAGQADFCEKCAHRRPDRAHHCRVCKRCVKRMDHVSHALSGSVVRACALVRAPPRAPQALTCGAWTVQHCLFVNNCVGAHNYKFFVLLLLYTVLGGLYNGVLSYAWVQMKKGRADNASSADNVLDFSRGMVVANGCTIAVISVVLLPFVCVHFYLAATNTTTLEALKGRTREYDLGSPMRNLKHVFGSRPWLWLSPFHSDIADQEPLLSPM